MTAERVALIRSRLEAAFAPDELEIIDDSRRHAGHEGARDGRGHFQVRIRSRHFSSPPSSAIGWFMLPWAR